MKLKGLIILSILVSLCLTFSVLWVRQRYSVAQSQQVLEKSFKVAGLKPEEGMFYTVDHKNKRILKWNRIVE